MIKTQMLSLCAMTLAFVLGGAFAFAADDPTHDGKLVSLAGDKLVMTAQGSTDGKEHTHMLSPEAKLTLDGKSCTADHLKAGTKIRVTTKAGETKVATHVEAIVKNSTFADTHDGTFTGTTGNKFSMTGKEHSHTIADNMKIDCDGKKCLIAELKTGMKIRVTTRRGDDNVAIRIEALQKNPEFASL